jgi:osmotically-inducible protein OsmY
MRLFRWQFFVFFGESKMSTFTDRAVLQKVQHKLSRLGGAQTGITASFNAGNVTLSGTIQYEMQRKSIMKVATSVPGVRRVIDQLKMKPKVRPM